MNEILPGMILKKISLELTEVSFLLEYVFAGDSGRELKSVDVFTSKHPGQLDAISRICVVMVKNIGKSVMYWHHDKSRSLTNFSFNDGTHGYYGDALVVFPLDGPILNPLWPKQ